MKKYQKPALPELKAKLSPRQFEVTQHEATEPPFQNEFWDHHGVGLYVDIVSGEPLFTSFHKFDSGCGWPSFDRPVTDESLITSTDFKIGYPRTEVKSKIAGSHLGHLFNDGPTENGLRYCINSAALRFVPLQDLVKEGYGEFQHLFERHTKR